MAESQPLLGQTVSHYRILEKLGGGGIGVVYKAEDSQLRRLVALKFLLDPNHIDPDSHHDLRAEARTASALNHPNICTIYEVGERSGDVFIAMEYVEGRTLSKMIRAEGLPEELVLRYALQIASGLEHAHKRGIVHRDLKPLNVIVTPQGDAKILDFGLARRGPPSEGAETLETAAIHAETAFAGTLPYMAPEQFEGRGTSPRTDIWSLGILLYELAAGSRPFHGDTLWHLSTSVTRDSTPPLPPHISPGLASVVYRCLEKDPARRYLTAGEVRVALETLSSAGRASPAPPPGRRPRYLGRLLATAGVVVILAVGYAALHFGYFSKRRGQPPVPSRVLLGLLLSSRSEDPAQAAYEDGLANTLNSRLGNLGMRNRLAVIPTSELRQKKVTTIAAARQQFGVNLVLLLSVQRAGEQARVNYGLVDTTSLQQVRSGSVTAQGDDPFGLQDRVFESVASDLQLQLAAERKQSQAAFGTLQPAAYDFYLQGRGYLEDYNRSENVAAAIQVFSRSLDRDPAYADAHAGLGEAYCDRYQLTHDAKWISAAIQDCQKATALDPTLPSGHVCLGRIFLGTGDYKRSLDEYGRAVELEPANDLAQGGLANVYERLNRLDEAEKTYKQAIAVRPEYWATYNWLGLFYQRHARYDDAKAMYSQVVSLAPDSFTGFSNLGGICVLQGRYAEAIPLFQLSLSIRPTSLARTNLATALFQMRRYAEAAVQFEEAVKLDASDYQMWGNLGDAYYWCPGRRAEAGSAYGKAISLAEEKLRVNPHDSEALGYLAMYRAMRGERKPALENLAAALRLSPKNPDLLLTAGFVYQQLGDTGRALDALEKAVAAGISPSSLSDTPNFDTLQTNQRFLKLIQH